MAVKTSAEALQQAIDDNFWQPNTATTAVPPSKPAPGSEGTGQFPSPFFRSHPYWVVANNLICLTCYAEHHPKRRNYEGSVVTKDHHVDVTDKTLRSLKMAKPC